MGLFNKLFGSKQQVNNPDNTKLLALLDEYVIEKGKEDTYRKVMLELMNGDSFLMFATENETATVTDKWTTAQKGAILKIASLINLDGLKVLGAFTDESSLVNWTKKPSQYTAMRSRDVLDFARENGIDRIVINSGGHNMLVIERNKENIKEHKIEKETSVQIGTTSKPLSQIIIKKLIDACKKNNTIEEVYQYGQLKEEEFSIVIGFKLAIYSENARKAAINAVQNALENEITESPLDIFFIESEAWYESIKRIDKSLVYKKE